MLVDIMDQEESGFWLAVNRDLSNINRSTSVITAAKQSAGSPTTHWPMSQPAQPEESHLLQMTTGQ